MSSMDYMTTNQPGDEEYAAWSQPVGPPTSSHPAPQPTPIPLQGTHVTLLPITPAHITDFWHSFAASPQHDRLHTYMLDGPWVDQAGFEAHQARFVEDERHGRCFFAIVPHKMSAVDAAPALGSAQGRFALINTSRFNRSTEVGHVILGPGMQQSRAATEAFYLLGKYVFEVLGYRRFEWKANDLNAPSKRAALRLGFKAEGVFRKHYIVKGRSRDTAWFSMIDDEWPLCKAAFEAWLRDENFDAEGRQKVGLKEIREGLAVSMEAKAMTNGERAKGEQ